MYTITQPDGGLRITDAESRMGSVTQPATGSIGIRSL
jgi:hypothetical protein